MIARISLECYYELLWRILRCLQILGHFIRFVFILKMAVKSVNVRVSKFPETHLFAWIIIGKSICAQYWKNIFPWIFFRESFYHCLVENNIRRNRKSFEILNNFPSFVIFDFYLYGQFDFMRYLLDDSF